MITCRIATEFSETPGPRYCRQGPDSGEEFYHRILNKEFAEVYQKDDYLILDLDNTNGYMSSFLDEAIGNLVYDFGEEVVMKRLSFISDEEPGWIKVIKQKIIPEWQEHRNKKQEPTITSAKHKEWYRLDNKTLKSKIWIEYK